VIHGPEVVFAGQTARFDASLSRDTLGLPLTFQWWHDGTAGVHSSLERVFDQPGFHRLGLTVNNGALASLAWRDLLVVRPVSQELGTEGQADRMGLRAGGKHGGQGAGPVRE